MISQQAGQEAAVMQKAKRDLTTKIVRQLARQLHPLTPLLPGLGLLKKALAESCCTISSTNCRQGLRANGGLEPCRFR